MDVEDNRRVMQGLLDVMGEHMPTISMWQEALPWLIKLCDKLGIKYLADPKNGELYLK